MQSGLPIPCSQFLDQIQDEPLRPWAEVHKPTPIHLVPRNPVDLPRVRNDSSLMVKISSKTVGRSKSGSAARRAAQACTLSGSGLRFAPGMISRCRRRWISATPSHSKRGCFLSSFSSAIRRSNHGDPIGYNGCSTNSVTKRYEEQFSPGPPKDGSTITRNLLNFSASFGVAGFLREHFFLRRYFIKFLQARNAVIRRVAESTTKEWRHSLS